MKIGFTERGDAGLDLSWFDKCAKRKVDGAVLITKNLTAAFRDKVLELVATGFPVVVHATTTGWGGSVVEPNVPPFRTQLANAVDLVNRGFDVTKLVIRIDPIFPTENGLVRLREVVAEAERLGLVAKDGSKARFRVSVLDEYPHVRKRFADAGFNPIYGGAFSAPDARLEAVADVLEETGHVFETCAEHKLAQFSHSLVERGCLSRVDLERLGLSWDGDTENNQHRYGCHCLGCKTELLTVRRPCPHNCLYCFWKRDGE